MLQNPKFLKHTETIEEINRENNTKYLEAVLLQRTYEKKEKTINR